jgi:predicted Zn-dependent peptidase
MALQKEKLDSGLRLFVDTVPGAETSNINIFVGTGSINEPEEVAGISHALEHCVHVSTDAFSNETKLNDFDGMNAIVSNAETSYNRTVYISSGPDIKPIIRRMGEILFRATYNPKAIKNEMSVIRREAYSRREDYYNLHDVSAFYAAFGKPYGRDVIGYADKLHFTPEQLKDYYDRHYVLSNMAIVAVGNVQIGELIDSVSEHFAGNQQVPGNVKLPEPTYLDADVTGLLQEGSDNATISITTPLDGGFVDKYIQHKQLYESAMRVIDNECNRVLRLKKGLSYDGGVIFRNDNHKNAWAIQGYVTVDQKNVDKARRVIKDVLSYDDKQYADRHINAAVGARRSSILSAMDSLEGRSDMHIHRLDYGQEPEDVRTVANSLKNLSNRAIRAAINDISDYISQSSSLSHITGGSKALKKAELLINPECIA